MNIAFVTTYDARNILNWSGLGYHISKSLEQSGNRIQYIGNLHHTVTPINFLKKVIYPRILKQDFPAERTIANARGYAKEVAGCLSGKEYDCVFSPGSIPIAYLETSKPKIIYTDATFASMLGYYQFFNNLSADIIRQGHELEKQALDSCSLAVYSSDWAARSAINDYGIDPSKVKVAPFGANLNVHYTKEEITSLIHERGRSTLRILFNGVDWKRKGGDLVFDTVEEITKRGVAVELHLVGIKDLPVKNLPAHVIDHGFLNKSLPGENIILENLFRKCHFLFVPSEAEAFGIVFCEASSFGMPSLSRKTGGITTAIKDGKNGFTLDVNAGVKEYADLILNNFTDPEKYAALALSSYNEYETRLNWNTTGNLITRYISEL